MAFYNNNRQQRNFRPQGKPQQRPQAQPQPQRSAMPGSFSVKPPLPPRVYTDADLHIDVVDLSFNDIRKVETGKYEDGVAVVEYLSEKQATDRGMLEQWQKAQPIDEYRQQEKD